MSYQTCEFTGEKAIELDQDNRKNGGKGANKIATKKGG